MVHAPGTNLSSAIRKRPEKDPAASMFMSGCEESAYSSPLRKAMATACVLFAAPSFCMAFEV